MIKKIVVAAISLILIGGIGVAFSYSRYVDQFDTIIETKPIAADRFQNVMIDAGSADVSIQAVKKESAARIEITGKTTSKESVMIDTASNQLSVIAEKENSDHKWVNFNFVPENQLSLAIFIPEKEYQSLEVVGGASNIDLKEITAQKSKISLDSGSITVKKMISDSVDMKTASGDIKVSELKGELEAKTDSGQIELSQIESNKLISKTSSGSTLLKDVTGEIDSQTDSGSIFISIAQVTKPLRVESNSGDIQIEVDQEPTDVSFNVQSRSGNIDLFNKYSPNASIGKKRPIVKLKTDSGAIQMTQRK